MRKIKGTVTEIERVQRKPPEDGVHRASRKDGFLKGVRCFLLNGKLMPKGQTAFYHRHKKNWGLKVFYKVDNAKSYRIGRKGVMKEWSIRKKLGGLIPKSPKVVKVKLNLKFKKQRIKTWAYAIKVEHVHYPKAPWEAYAKGHPYDFMALDQTEHPLHNPAGFLAFQKKARKFIKRTGLMKKMSGGDPSLKLGDIVYCTKKKKWRLVDCG